MIRIVVALFFFAYAYAFSIMNNGPLIQEKLFKAVLEVKNPRHQNFIDLMNNDSSLNEEGSFENELKKNGYVCLFSKFDIVFKNSSKSFSELLDNGNEDILKEAANDFKIKLIQVIDHLSEVISLKDLRINYKQVFQDYVYQLGDGFFGYSNKNKLNQDTNSIFNTSEVISKLTNYSHRESEEASEEGSDLSKANNEENLNKMSETSYLYKSFTSNHDDVSHQIEGNSENETMTREKALDILIKNSILVIEGECNEETPKKNDEMRMRFGGKIEKNSFTTLCGLSGCGIENNSSFLRKAGEQNGLNFFNNKRSVDELVSNMYKLLENTFGINMMRNPLLMNHLTSEDLRLEDEQVNKEEQTSESSVDSETQKDISTAVSQKN